MKNTRLPIFGQLFNSIQWIFLFLFLFLFTGCSQEDITHKDLFKLLEIFCSVEVRKTFLDCLNVEFDTEDEYGDIKTINILDL